MKIIVSGLEGLKGCYDVVKYGR